MRPTASVLLKKARVPALLVSNLLNIRYLTGCKMTAGLLLVLPKGYFLFVDDRYTEAAAKQALPDVKVKNVKDIADHFQKIRRCGFESDDVTVARLKRWQTMMKSTKFVQTFDSVEGFRRKKSPEEIRYLMKARSLTKSLLKAVPSLLKVGMKESDLAWELETLAHTLGGEGMSFETIVAFGPNTSRPHHRPTDRILEKGDLVQIDCGVKYKGFCGDLSEVYFTAPPTKEQKQVLILLKRSYNTALKLVKKGASNRALDKAARDVLREEGMHEAFLHSLGHGVGLDVHEGVNLSSRAKNTPLEKGEVITLEPGVYFPGKFGMRIEDMVVVK